MHLADKGQPHVWIESYISLLCVTMYGSAQLAALHFLPETTSLLTYIVSLDNLLNETSEDS